MAIFRQAAFIDADKMLKGGLHAHTTRSDGKLAPEEAIRQYAANGYDFLALTDHRLYNYTNYAPETGLLILPGMEMDRSLTSGMGHCFHTVVLGPEKAAGNGYAQDERFAPGVVSDQREYQPLIDSFRANNNLVIYCHPDWSRTPARSFDQLYGYFAMEIWNSGCACANDMDTDNGNVWDELLMQGKRVGAVATDDGHCAEHNCLGWVRVNAEKNAASILDALENQRYYASCGPEIYDFRIEDGVAKVDCSPCRFINFLYGRSPSRQFREGSGLITHAEFAVPAHDRYLRAVVMDDTGRKAWTNPIFIHS